MVPLRFDWLQTPMASGFDIAVRYRLNKRRSDSGMPQVVFENQTFTCQPGERLRNVMLENGCSPHNGTAKIICCHGMGTCGTCAVKIEGDVPELTRREKARLAFPPHNRKSGLRLACQVKVESDIVVKKFPGFWGQNVPKN